MCSNSILKTTKNSGTTLSRKTFLHGRSSNFNTSTLKGWAIPMLQKQGWIYFSCINEPHFLELVRLFYCNFSDDPSSFSIHSSVLRNKIVITHQLLSDLFSILEWAENILFIFTPTNQCLTSKRLTIYCSIFGQNATTVIKATSSSLISFYLSLVCLVVGHDNLPNWGHQDELRCSCDFMKNVLTAWTTSLWSWKFGLCIWIILDYWTPLSMMSKD